jgi:hypothetical protein
LRQVSHNWLSLSGWKKTLTVGAFCLLTLVAMLSYFLWTGVAAALQARDHFDDVQTKLQRLSPVDMLNAGLYQFLATQFRDAEQSAGRARSRLRFLGLFKWLPGIGGRIKESLTQLEMAYFLARAGRNLATTYQGALELLPADLSAEEASQRITEALEKALPSLIQVEADLQRVRQFRNGLAAAGLNNRYASLIDTYLPQVQAVIYISRINPRVTGQAYAISRELTALDDLTVDPLLVVSQSAQVKQSLAIILERSRWLVAELEVMRAAAKENASQPPGIRGQILPAIELMLQGAVLLENVTAVTQGLLALSEAVEKHGFLTREFGQVAGPALKDAEARLILAKEEGAALRLLLAQRKGGGDASRPSPLLSSTSGISSGSLDRLEVLLGRAFDGVRFQHWFLGFQGPRTYLVLGQNQQEIRATGGLIGVAVQITLDQGHLVSLRYHDSTTVDALPPQYPNNPPAPEPIYWYLWMERLLFRDANWSPHFPASAALIADLYRLGQGVQVDGVITGTKGLIVDMVDLLGDISVPSLSEPLTRETADYYTNADNSPYQCSQRHVSGRGKRCFDEDLFFALNGRLSSRISDKEKVAIIRLFKTALDRGNILVHVFEPEQAKTLTDLGWNGAIPLINHDYLLVVDSSFPGHTAGAVVRHWDYQVSLQVGKPAMALLRVRYDHQGTRLKGQICRQSEFFECYWNYFRIYVPRTATNVVAPPVPLHEGSEKLIWGYSDADSGSLVRDSDTGPARLTEVGGYIAVAPDSITTVPLEYQLPWELVRPIGRDSYEYRLLVQKQPGMDRDRVSVAVELPLGTELLATSPAPKTRNGRWVTFDFPLDSDKQVVITFKISSR